jgi:hypothetical protein
MPSVFSKELIYGQKRRQKTRLFVDLQYSRAIVERHQHPRGYVAKALLQIVSHNTGGSK